MVAHMPPKPKKRDIKSIVDGFSSLFSSSKGRRREEQTIAHGLPPVEGSPGNHHPLPPLKESEGSVTHHAIPVTATEHLLPSNTDVGPSTGAHAQGNSSHVEQTASISMFSNAQKFNVENIINIDSSQHVQNVQGNRIDGT